MTESASPASPGGMTVREATPADAKAVTALLHVAYPASMAAAYPPDVLRLALPAMTRANPDLLRSGTYFVAETEGGDLIGCGGWSRERPGNGDTAPGVGHVRHFGTHPDWARRGVGRALFNACTGQCREAGIRVLECYASLNAVPFYAALGFHRIGEREIALTPDRHIASTHMRLDL